MLILISNAVSSDRTMEKNPSRPRLKCIESRFDENHVAVELIVELHSSPCEHLQTLKASPQNVSGFVLQHSERSCGVPQANIWEALGYKV